ncbi:MAG: ComEC/Rec2 family competence protein [bacterium]|nr:ComEC/Rec2 family competence protein [bacterium]
MPLHNLAFWFCAFFLAGIFLISIFNNFLIALVISLLVVSYLVFLRKYIFALLALAMILGAGYYQIFGVVQKSQTLIRFDEKIEFQGIVKDAQKSATSQQLILDLELPLNGKVRINAQRYPDFNYGDLVNVTGVIKNPPARSENYYKKEGISGIVSFPEIRLLETGRGNPALAALFSFKESIENVFRKILPQEKAAFLSGITLGERESFSKELEEKMSLSGTTHLVALSGYNITVIALAIGWLFGSFLARRASFYLSVAVIVLFVLMAGAEASVVRAAIMGIIALVAQHTERAHSVRNAIIIAAFLMVLANPRVLVFDLGFQLSFAALLGIIYISPVLKKVLKIQNQGFLNWRENLVTTLSAQLAVVPFLLGNFGAFSLTSFLANILVLEAVPVTMGLGFLAGGLGLMTDFLAKIIGWLLNILIGYEFWVINIFSKITLPIAVESFGFLPAIIYYVLLVGLIYKLHKLS